MLKSKELSFSVFLIHKLALAWNSAPKQVYDILVKTEVLDNYIIPCYDCLHTLGEEYLIEDITEMVRERGAIL